MFLQQDIIIPKIKQRCISMTTNKAIYNMKKQKLINHNVVFVILEVLNWRYIFHKNIIIILYQTKN